MNNTIMDNLQRAREEFEAALDNFLAALDKEHYPDSLRESMTAVLKAPGAPRGLPLFLQNLAQSRGVNFPSGLLVASECLLRAFLLLAQLQIENNSKIEKSVSSRLSKKYSQAQLLLTADTLFTWPVELTAGETVSDSRPLSLSLAEAFGINGCLAALDSTDASGAELMKLNPFMELIRALGISDIESNKGIRLTAQWLYCNELKHWFGRDAPADRALKELEVELSGLVGCEQPQARSMAELVSFLKD